MTGALLAPPSRLKVVDWAPTVAAHTDASMNEVTLPLLEQALGRGEFLYWYQPKISMVLGTVAGAEALIRWRREDGTLVPPSAFIPLAESTGFITEVTLHMLDHLVRDAAAIHAVHHDAVISFNVSARDVADDRLVRQLAARVGEGDLPAERIEVELTESAALAAEASFAGHLAAIRELGLRLAMDDFGTGYSSIDTLSALPFTTVKIDQGIVRRMDHSPKDASLVHSSIRMGHSLGIEVVAEGIETETTFRRLQNAGCCVGQGYWMGRPMPLVDYLGLLRSTQRWPSGAMGLVHMATLDHIEWRKDLIDELLALESSGEPPGSAFDRFEAKSTECRLGRWFHGPGRRLAGMAAYHALARPHHALHDTGARIVKAARRGARMEDLLPEVDELSAFSSRVIHCLQALEVAVLAHTHVRRDLAAA